MTRRTFIPLFHCFLFVLILSASAELSRQKRTSLSGKSKCLHLDYLLKEAYYAQVDLIRRGIPTHIIQSAFTCAINYFISINNAFRYKALKTTCVPNEDWKRVFDDSFRARLAIRALNVIRSLVGNITFLSLETNPILPPLERSKEELVHTMWLTCLARLKERPRNKYKASDFSFPKNVDILHDPERHQACQQFHKFDTPSHRNYDPDATSVLVALTMVSINLYKKGANVRSIAQMITHFVGFVFNGIRCTRQEGGDLKVPKTLLEAYARNIAMIGSETKSDVGMSEFRMKPEAVMRVFNQDFRLLLSYNCWGHLQYVQVSQKSSVPYKVSFLRRLFGGTHYTLLMIYSQTTSVDRQQVATRNSIVTEENAGLTPSGVRDLKCGEGYVLMPREEPVRDPLEHCCNTICYRWSLLIPGYVSYSAEGCCERCNQVNMCDPGVTRKDLSDNNFYSFYIPEYGEQSQIEMFLIAI